MPQPFFRSLPCDNCGCRIKLSLPWRILFLFISLFGFILAFSVANSVHIRFLGSTLFVSLVIFVVLYLVIDQTKRLILRYGKWVEIKQK
jgi:hypothetical protein